MSVAEAQERISSAEFTYWIAYFNIEPFGHHVANQYAAQNGAIVANANLRKGAKPYGIEDLMLKTGTPKRQSMQEQKSIFMAFMNAHNRNIEAKNNG